ncbi:MAG: Mn transporter [Candidatus Diapherotrites archaeon CG08_land_8_20_14_0_20_34_12]|nr:MAG: Mn transporter [Candidatus Diapherotrites archaeon CG08_land_8_20_14_0_20_34_12]
MAFKISKKMILLFLMTLGPGIITSAVDNDAGGIATYSIAGSQFGYGFLWAMIPIALVLIIIQEMGVRMGIITGKGLSDLIREHFRIKITMLLMLGLIITNLGNVLGEFAGIAASGEMFGLSKYLLVPLCAIFVWVLIVKGNYKTMERAFLFACLFYISYVIAGFMANPNWAEISQNMVMPQINLSNAYILMLVGLIGTTIAPWMQFYLQSAVVEKGIRKEQYNYSKIDVIIGSLVTVIVMFFIIVATSATLFKNGIIVNSAADAALALEPFAGAYASILFGLGLFMASLFAAAILPLSTAYFVCEAFGWDSSVNKKFKEAPQFYGLITFLILIGALTILIPNIPLIPIMYLSQVINGLMLPIILIMMLLIINNKKIMGQYTNGKWFNIIAWISAIALSILSIVLVLQTIGILKF